MSLQNDIISTDPIPESEPLTASTEPPPTIQSTKYIQNLLTEINSFRATPSSLIKPLELFSIGVSRLSKRTSTNDIKNFISSLETLESLRPLTLNDELSSSAINELEAHKTKNNFPSFEIGTICRGKIPDKYIKRDTCILADEGADSEQNIVTKLLLNVNDKRKIGRKCLVNNDYVDIGIALEKNDDEFRVVVIMAKEEGKINVEEKVEINVSKSQAISSIKADNEELDENNTRELKSSRGVKEKDNKEIAHKKEKENTKTLPIPRNRKKEIPSSNTNTNTNSHNKTNTYNRKDNKKPPSSNSRTSTLNKKSKQSSASDIQADFDISELKQTFDLFDVNEEGIINPSEVCDAMLSINYDLSNPEIYQVMMDLSNDDKTQCTWEKFANKFINKVNDKFTDEGLRSIFNLYLEDPKDEFITASNMKKICRELGEKDNASILNKMIGNKAGEAKISFEEFKQFIFDKYSQ